MKLIERTKGTPGPGRPRVTITEEGLTTVEDLAANGNGDAAIAKVLGVNPRTLRRLRDDEESGVAEALEVGRSRLASELVDILLQKARKGDSTCAMFLLKAKCGMRDTGPVPASAQNAVQVNIQLPARLSEKEFAELVKVKNGG